MFPNLNPIVGNLIDIAAFALSNVLVSILLSQRILSLLHKAQNMANSQLKGTDAVSTKLRAYVDSWTTSQKDKEGNRGPAIIAILSKADEMYFGGASWPPVTILLFAASLAATVFLGVLLIKYRYSRPLRL